MSIDSVGLRTVEVPGLEVEELPVVGLPVEGPGEAPGLPAVEVPEGGTRLPVAGVPELEEGLSSREGSHCHDVDLILQKIQLDLPLLGRHARRFAESLL